MPADETPGCRICGRDNDNGTHDALQLTGHLSHRYDPVPSAGERDGTAAIAFARWVISLDEDIEARRRASLQQIIERARAALKK